MVAVHHMAILMCLMHADKITTEGIMQIGKESMGMIIVLITTAIDGETGGRTTQEGLGMNMTVVGIEIKTVISIEDDLEGENMMTDIDDNGGLALHHVVVVSSLLNTSHYLADHS